jgi:hypothetical protein
MCQYQGSPVSEDREQKRSQPEVVGSSASPQHYKSGSFGYYKRLDDKTRLPKSNIADTQPRTPFAYATNPSTTIVQRDVNSYTYLITVSHIHTNSDTNTIINQDTQNTEGTSNDVETAKRLYLAAARQVFETVQFKALNNLGDDVFELILAIKPFPLNAREHFEAKNRLLDNIEIENPQFSGYFSLELKDLGDES